MTVRSEHKAFIRYQTGDLASYDGADTDLARTIRNNLHHALDSHGQVLVAWSSAAEGVVIVNQPVIVPSGYLTADIETHLWTSPPFYVRLQENGAPFPVRVAAYGGQTGGIGSTGFRVALTTGDDAGQWLVDAVGGQADATQAPDASMTNVAHVLTGIVGWMSLSPNILTLTAERARDATVSVSTVSAIGGSPATVEVVRCRLTVWRGGTEAGIYALYAAEYCGGP